MVRSHRLIIVLCTVVLGSAAYGLSVAQPKEYLASATLALRLESQDLDLVRSSPTPPPSADARPSINADQVKRADLIETVKENLGTTLSISVIRSKISARVEPKTNVLIVEARTGDPLFAAQLATAFTRAIANRITRSQRARYRQAGRSIEERLRGLARRRDRPETGLAITNLRERLAQLEALQEFARPVDVLRPAEVPTTPEKPRPIRNAILGLIAGLILGLLAAFAREALDRRVRGTTDLEEQLELPLVGHVSEDALGATPLSLNGRGPLTPADIESFRILRMNLDFMRADEPLRTVMVTSGLPEEGKTSVSVALAGVNVAAGRRTLLLECDLRRPSISERLGVAAQPGLTDYLAGKASPADILQQVKLGDSLGASEDERSSRRRR